MSSTVQHASLSRPKYHPGEVESNSYPAVLAVTNLVRAFSIVELPNGSNSTLSARFPPARHLVKIPQYTLGPGPRNYKVWARWAEFILFTVLENTEFNTETGGS